MNKIFETIYNIISPKDIKCIICDDELNKIQKGCMCKNCKSTLPVITKSCIRCGAEIFSKSNICIECKAENKTFKQAIAPFNYTGKVTSLVYRLKYGDETYLAPYMADFMIDKLKEVNFDFDIVMPVPLSKNRYKLRTYNQAEFLAEPIAKAFDKPLDTTTLTRVIDTKTQTHLSKSERKQNLMDAFKITNKSCVKNKNILIVDDIFTTGATSNEIAKILLLSGCKNVYIVTFAHAVNKKEMGNKQNNTKIGQK